MKTNVATDSDFDRARRCLQVYGAQRAQWPEADAAAVAAAIAQSPELQRLVQAQGDLERLLDSYEVTPTLSVNGVLTALDALESSGTTTPNTGSPAPPRSTDDSFDVFNWLLPSTLAGFWRPAAFAAASLALGMVLGISELGLGFNSADWSVSEQYVFAPVAVEATND